MLVPFAVFALATATAYLGFFGLNGLASIILQTLFLMLLVALAASALLDVTQKEPPV